MKYVFLNEISCGTARNFQSKMASCDCICSGTLLFDLGRDVAILMGGEWCGRPGRRVSRGSEMKNLNENDFLCLTDFKLLSQVK